MTANGIGLGAGCRTKLEISPQTLMAAFAKPLLGGEANSNFKNF